VAAVAGQVLETDLEKTVFLRVSIDGEVDGMPRVVLSGGQSSNVLTAAASADGLAVVPRGVGSVAEGGRVVLELSRAPEAREETDV
jgi:molybdopterin biosynthesis enzyme